MSIKKLAKSINNLADAIRYHADGGATSATMTRSPLPEGFKVPKYEGKETEHCLSAVAPQPLTEAEENFVDPYDAPPKADYTIITPQPPAAIAPDADITVSAEANDLAPPVVEKSDRAEWAADAPPPPPEPTHPLGAMVGAAKAVHDAIHAPGWQTLTVEELDAAPSVEVDADGLPWDERIHSGGKTLLVDGTWRLKRGVPDEEYQEVVAELKKLMAIPAPDTVKATLTDPATTRYETPVGNVPPPPPAPSAIVDNLPAFIKAITGAGIDKDVVLAAVKNAGLENVMQLGARPDLIAGIAKELGL